MKDNTNIPKYKTAILDKAQMSDLKKYVKSFPSMKQAADKLGVSNQLLDRILEVGRTSPANAEKINGKVKDWMNEMYESAA